MKKIAIIGSGIIAKSIAIRAKKIEVETHCFSWNDQDVACGAVDYFYKVNIFDINKIIETCLDVDIDGVIATTELTILPTAKVAEALKLLGNPINVAEDITNKYLTRNKVRNVANLNQPNYWMYAEGDLPKIEKFPVIVKPIAAGGKRGIGIVYSSEELDNAIQEALSYSKVKGVLIEEFLDGGKEYSVESISHSGRNYILQITEKDTSGPPQCNELGHHQPADLDSKTRERVKQVVSDMITDVGIIHGPCHTEIKIIDGEIFLIEINARPGGDHITDVLTELSTGYPFVSSIIWNAINDFEGNEPLKLEDNQCGICFITEETSYLKPLFDRCERYQWFYAKNKVSDMPSKIVFNDEDNLNYFIYFSKDKTNNIAQLIKNNML